MKFPLQKTTLLCFALLCLPLPAYSCLCIPMPESTEEAYNRADAVFYGVVTDVSKVARGGAYHFGFVIEKSWKGPSSGEITLYANKSTASCGIGLVSEGQRYLFYATSRAHGNEFKVNSCNRHLILSNAARDIRELNKIINDGEKQ